MRIKTYTLPSRKRVSIGDVPNDGYYIYCTNINIRTGREWDLRQIISESIARDIDEIILKHIGWGDEEECHYQE